MLARIPHAELESLFDGYGYKCYFVEGDEPAAMHQKMAATMDAVDRGNQGHSEGRAHQRFPRAPGLADDHPAFSQGMDGPEGTGRQAGRRHVPRSPGASRRA